MLSPLCALAHSRYRLRWNPGAQHESQRVLASAGEPLLPSGALAAPSLLDLVVPTGATTAVLSLPADGSLELVRWQVLSRGCNDTQQATGDVTVLTL